MEEEEVRERREVRLPERVALRARQQVPRAGVPGDRADGGHALHCEDVRCGTLLLAPRQLTSGRMIHRAHVPWPAAVRSSAGMSQRAP